MKRLTIEIPEKSVQTVFDLVKLLGGRVVQNLNLDLEAVVFMKYGYHAKEGENDIIKRKKLEFKNTGVMFWGYGGTVCHPEKQVQRFVKSMHLKGKKVYLAMSLTDSKFENEGESSLQYSTDNLRWTNVPEGIAVLGSKHAIVCSELIDCNLCINLNNYSVAVGASAGTLASNYIKFRVDKGCFIKTNDEKGSLHEIKIQLLAEIVEPYAVFMK